MATIPRDLARAVPARLADVSEGALASFRPASDVLAAATPGEERTLLEANLASFVRDVGAVLGHARLPAKELSWATLDPTTGEPGLRTADEHGELELRCWEGRFRPSRLPRERGRARVVLLLGRVLDWAATLGEPERERTAQDPSASGRPATLVEWRGAFRDGRFERVVALAAGLDLFFLLAPALERPAPTRAHESAPDLLLAAASRRARPPSAHALPTPLKLPPGGRFSKRPVQKRRKEPR